MKKPIGTKSSCPRLPKTPGGGAGLEIGAFYLWLVGASPIPLPGSNFPLPVTPTSIKPGLAPGTGAIGEYGRPKAGLEAGALAP